MMIKVDRILWTGLLIPIAMTVAGVVGGIEWAFASLGAIVLIGMIGIGIYVLAKALQHSAASLKAVYLECNSTSDVSFGGDDLKHVTYSKSANTRPISKKDKRLIMEHIDELFEMGREQSQGKPAEAKPISEEDKRLIMEHIDELFEMGREQSQGKPAEARPISEEDKRLIMEEVDEFLRQAWGKVM
ncbi:hypothetical protein ACFLX0_02955 [Chloroflexota bacterium]